MVLPTPDYSDCREKKRCLTGPNSGQVYTAEAPCEVYGSSTTFNADACDCELPAVAQSRWDRADASYDQGFCPDPCTYSRQNVSQTSIVTSSGPTPHQLQFYDNLGNPVGGPVCDVPEQDGCSLSYVYAFWNVLDASGTKLIFSDQTYGGGSVQTSFCHKASDLQRLCDLRPTFTEYL